MFIGGMTLHDKIIEKLRGPTNYFELAAKTPKQEPQIFRPDCLKDGDVVTVSLSRDAIEHLRYLCKQKQEAQEDVNIEETEEYIILDAILSGKNTMGSKILGIPYMEKIEDRSRYLVASYARQYQEIVEQHREGKRAIFCSIGKKDFHIATLEEELDSLNEEYTKRIVQMEKDHKTWISETYPYLLNREEKRVERLKVKVDSVWRLNEKIRNTIELSRSEMQVERYKVLCQQKIPEGYKDAVALAMMQFVEQYESQREKGNDLNSMLKNISLFGQGINGDILKRILS